jgi:hypothetical protein
MAQISGLPILKAIAQAPLPGLNGLTPCIYRLTHWTCIWELDGSTYLFDNIELKHVDGYAQSI